MPGAAVEIQVEGLRELNLALRQLDKKTARRVRKTIRMAVEPMRARAEGLARTEIRNIGDTWPRMRTGSNLSLVYIVPRTKRGRGGNMRARPNLAPLLWTRAMEPAKEQKQGEVVKQVDLALRELVRAF